MKRICWGEGLERPGLLMGVLLVGALLSGCVQDPGDDSAPPVQDPHYVGPVFANGTAAPLTINFNDCYEHGGSFPVPAQDYAARLPQGFRPAPYTALGTLEEDPPDGVAEIYAAGSRCTADDGSEIMRAIVSLFVHPPAHWQDGEVGFGYLYLLSYVTASPQNKEIFDAWGFQGSVFAGDATLESTQTPAIRTASTRATTSDGVSFLVESVTLGQSVAMDGSMARFIAASENGTVIRAADARFNELQAALGSATLSGSTSSGVWPEVDDQPGIGMHAWGHTNVWTYVDPPSQQEG